MERKMRAFLAAKNLNQMKQSMDSVTNAMRIQIELLFDSSLSN